MFFIKDIRIGVGSVKKTDVKTIRPEQLAYEMNVYNDPNSDHFKRSSGNQHPEKTSPLFTAPLPPEPQEKVIDLFKKGFHEAADIKDFRKKHAKEEKLLAELHAHVEYLKLTVVKTKSKLVLSSLAEEVVFLSQQRINCKKYSEAATGIAPYVSSGGLLRTHPEVLCEYGIALTRSHQAPKAVSFIELNIEKGILSKDSAEVSGVLGSALVECERFPEALKVMEKFFGPEVTDKKDSFGSIAYLKALRGVKNPRQVLANTEELISEGGLLFNSAEAHYLRAKAWLDAGDPVGVMEDLAPALGEEGRFAGEKKLQRCFVEAMLQNGEVEFADEYLGNLFEKDKTYFSDQNALSTQIKIKIKQGKEEEALALSTRFAPTDETRPVLAVAHVRAMLAVAKKQSDPGPMLQEAYDYLEPKVNGRRPLSKNIFGSMALADILRAQGKDDEAFAFLSKRREYDEPFARDVVVLNYLIGLRAEREDVRKTAEYVKPMVVQGGRFFHDEKMQKNYLTLLKKMNKDSVARAHIQKIFKDRNTSLKQNLFFNEFLVEQGFQEVVPECAQRRQGSARDFMNFGTPSGTEARGRLATRGGWGLPSNTL